MARRVGIEVCCEGAVNAAAAARGGASRVELCANLGEGGVTPSVGDVMVAVQATKAASSQTEIHVLIRPRAGDFCYREEEVAVMKADIEACKRAGASGVVIGALNPDGSINRPLLRELVDLARPELHVTFHRAFDVCSTPPLEALHELRAVGIHRLLTSGRAASAWEGREMLRQLVAEASRGRGSGGRDNGVSIMAGGGVTLETAVWLTEYCKGHSQQPQGGGCKEGGGGGEGESASAGDEASALIDIHAGTCCRAADASAAGAVQTGEGVRGKGSPWGVDRQIDEAKVRALCDVVRKASATSRAAGEGALERN